mmetsp:Transcript_3440/g.8529  ORF Transcript_3440/g.8529 Transcript_3440/m.8529 type:complete len:212 (-) Transcript_3440:305-940(-)
MPDGGRGAWPHRTAARRQRVAVWVVLHQLQHMALHPTAHVCQKAVDVPFGVEAFNHGVRQGHGPSRPCCELIRARQQFRQRLPPLHIRHDREHQRQILRGDQRHLSDAAATADCGDAYRRLARRLCLLRPTVDVDAVAGARQLVERRGEEVRGVANRRIVQRLACALEDHVPDLVVDGERSDLPDDLARRQVPLEAPAGGAVPAHPSAPDL